MRGGDVDGMNDKIELTVVLGVVLIFYVPLRVLFGYFFITLLRKAGYLKWLLSVAANMSYFIIIIYLLSQSYINRLAFLSLIVLQIISLFFIRRHLERRFRKDEAGAERPLVP